MIEELKGLCSEVVTDKDKHIQYKQTSNMLTITVRHDDRETAKYLLRDTLVSSNIAFQEILMQSVSSFPILEINL